MPWLINTPNLVESFTYLSNQGHVNQYVKIALKTAKSAHPDHLNYLRILVVIIPALMLTEVISLRGNQNSSLIGKL